ncbi:MAG: TRAP transporter small permease [Candidatus Latescibacteria bacterium]|nr:TRAP transporter small permease [Candidatus Latescibacterota bacterium]
MTTFFRIIDRLLDICVSVVLASMTAVVTVNVFCRFVLSFSLSWGDEVAQILLVWMTFLGAAVAMRTGAHYAFDYLVRSIPDAPGRFFSGLSQLIVIAMTFLLAYWGIQVTIQISGWIMPATGISRAWVYSACPVGSVFMLLYAVKNFVKST